MALTKVDSQLVGGAITTDSSGNVGIGTATALNPAAGRGNLTINGSSDGIINFGIGGSLAGYIQQESSGTTFLSSGATYQRFFTGGSERLRILSSGDMLLGQTAYSTPPTQGNDFFCGGLVINPTRRTTGSAANCNWDASTGVFYRSTSSLRYKTDVQDASYGLSDVLKLRPVTYKGKAAVDENKVFGGFIAEEVDAIGLKEFVEYDAEGNPDSLAYANMVSLLAKAIQELKSELDATKAEVAALKAAA